MPIRKASASANAPQRLAIDLLDVGQLKPIAKAEKPITDARKQAGAAYPLAVENNPVGSGKHENDNDRKCRDDPRCVVKIQVKKKQGNKK